MSSGRSKRIRRKNKGGAITQRVANALSVEFGLARAMGYTSDDILTEWEFEGLEVAKGRMDDAKAWI